MISNVIPRLLDLCDTAWVDRTSPSRASLTRPLSCCFCPSASYHWISCHFPLPTLWMCPLKNSYTPTASFPSDSLSYRIHSQVFTLTLHSFIFLLQPKPQIDISMWVFCSILDTTCSKPSPFSFPAILIRALLLPIPSGWKLRHHPWHSLPPKNPFNFRAHSALLPQHLRAVPFCCHHYSLHYGLWLSHRLLLPMLLTGLPSNSALTSVYCQCDASSPSRVQYRWVTPWFKVLSYVPLSNQLQPLGLAFSTSPLGLQGCQALFFLYSFQTFIPHSTRTWTFSLESSYVFLLLNLWSCSFFPWNALALFSIFWMLLTSQVLP